MPIPYGGSFLLEAPPDVFTPEDFTAEHRAIAKTTDDFWTREVAPNVEAIQQQDFDVLKRTLRKSAELGLIGVLLGEEYGGMDLDLVSSLIVAENVGRDGSYAVCHGGQSGIGILPVSLFGTDAQKQKYLPRLASAELIAAYCLTEAQAGSDPLAARTRADLSTDGTHYVLNGQKMWITNGGIADLFTVFAKVGGEQFTAFLVERAWPGVSPGAEEKKMGLKGSSTTAVFFDHVKVPVENVLGEIGHGHIIAFNILNLGRLNLAVSAHGKCRQLLADSIRYAKERRAFGKSIAEFGLIQHKLNEWGLKVDLNLVSPRTVKLDADADPSNGAQLDARFTLSADCAGRTLTSTCGLNSPSALIDRDGTAIMRIDVCKTSPCEAEPICRFHVISPLGIPSELPATFVFNNIP